MTFKEFISPRFGGIHLGTEKAAIERLENTPSQRIGGRPGKAFIYAFEVHLQKPYNSPENPMTEHDLFMLINFDGIQEIGKEYDGLYYRNNIEDKGSISILVFDKSVLKLVDTKEVIA